MERVTSINIERIYWCSADHGITIGELAAELNMSEASLLGVMDGSGS